MSFLNLLKTKKNEPKKEVSVAAPPVKKLAVREDAPSALPVAVGAGVRETFVVLRPRITEKATALSERGVYAFEVMKDATERAVKTAIRSLYKVSPVKVAFVPIRSKEIIVKGKKGRTKGGKKAYVYLKAGDRIDNL